MSIAAAIISVALQPAHVTDINQVELECLALNIYHEARGESEEGQKAVAHVTINRVNNSYFPSTICGVVWQDKQFSWTHDGKSDRPTDQQAWQKALKIAKDVYQGQAEDNTGGSVFYHADHVKPSWSRHKSMTPYAMIDNHQFYVWSGTWN